MPTEPTSRTRIRRRFPVLGIAVLLALCIAPIVALFSVGAWLERDCATKSTTSGEAGPNFVWRIDVEQCGKGPLVTNVLVAPHGKTLALAASSVGNPRPTGVQRSADGTTFVVLEGGSGNAPTAVLLPLKASGRPATPLVLADGRPKR